MRRGSRGPVGGRAASRRRGETRMNLRESAERALGAVHILLRELILSHF